MFDNPHSAPQQPFPRGGHVPGAGARSRMLLTVLALGSAAAGADPHILRPPTELERDFESQPLQILASEISRPKARGDITLKVEASFGGGSPYLVKLRRAEPGADQFNNRPRYDRAVYEVQKLFLDPHEYVVPPTSLRMMPLAQLHPHSPAAKPTFAGSDDVLVVLQYWLQDVTNAEDVYDPALFDSDPVYARHVGQLNILTFLVAHADSNVGNFLISKSGDGPRVFSVDNGVAFSSEPSDRSKLWRELRVKRLPADALERLRRLDKAQLRSRLGVLAQWELRDGHYVAVPPGRNMSPYAGVRIDHGTLQMGLTYGEIARLWSRLEGLLRELKRGEIDTF